MLRLLKYLRSTHIEFQTKKATENSACYDAASKLASVGSHVLTPDVSNILGKLARGLGNEIYLVYAINFRAQRDVFNTMVIEGTRFDCRSIDDFIFAINN